MPFWTVAVSLLRIWIFGEVLLPIRTEYDRFQQSLKDERCVLAYEKRNCKGFSHRGRIPRLVFGKSDAYSLSYKGNAASLLLQNLKLIDCTTEEADLAFEYSGVHADIKGAILSVKNPRRGKIEADRYGSVILSDGVYPSKAKILKRIK